MLRKRFGIGNYSIGIGKKNGYPSRNLKGGGDTTLLL